MRRVDQLVWGPEANGGVCDTLQILTPKVLAAALALVRHAFDKHEPALALGQNEIARNCRQYFISRKQGNWRNYDSRNGRRSCCTVDG